MCSGLGSPAPGMLTWVCSSCPDQFSLYSATAELLSPAGLPVGRLLLQQSVERGSGGVASGRVRIENSDTRVRLQNMKERHRTIDRNSIMSKQGKHVDH